MGNRPYSMASLQQSTSLRQRRRLQKLANKARVSCAKSSIKNTKNAIQTKTIEPSKTTQTTTTTTMSQSSSPTSSNESTSITAVPPHRPLPDNHKPSPRRNKFNTREPASNSKKETKVAVAIESIATSTTTATTTTTNTTRCKLVYTGSFGVGYTCSVCNVFREWRKVYLCKGASNEAGTLGRHFAGAGKTKKKYLQFVDGTRVPSMSPLPPEILEIILGCLDFRGMCKCETTCTDWYRIGHSKLFSSTMANRDRKNLNHLTNGKTGSESPPRKSKKSEHMMSFVDVVHAAVRSARNACRTIALEQEIPSRITNYRSRDVKINQLFRHKLKHCSNNWLAFLLDELSGLCKDNEHRKDHPAFLAKLRFIDKELVRRKTGRSASHIENIEWLEQMRRKVKHATRAGQRPRMGEAKIRDLKCNWRK